MAYKSNGSPLTANRRIGLLDRFHDLTGIGPYDLLKMSTIQIEDMLSDRFDEFERKGFASSYILEFKKAIRFWLDFNNVSFNSKKVKVRATASSTGNEQVPTVEQLKKLLSSSFPKTRVMVSLMTYSFLRPETLGNWNGSDDLKMEDFPEMSVEAS